MANFGVIITCCESDFLLAKGTCASFRHFMPEVPICLLVDGDFDMGRFPESYDIIVLNRGMISNDFLRKNSWGWGVTKMNAFWESPFDNFLLVDADTVLYGDISGYADFENYDFIIDRPEYEYTVEDINKFFFNTELVEKFYPGFSYSNNPYVCTGIIYGKKNVLDIKDYVRFFEIAAQEKDFFRAAEQGFLNILFFLKSQSGDIRLSSCNMQFLVPDYEYQESKNRFPIPISKPDSPQLIHWAGPIKPTISAGGHTYVEPMTYFRTKYLSDLGIEDEAQQRKILMEEDSNRERAIKKRRLQKRINKGLNIVKGLFSKQ